MVGKYIKLFAIATMAVMTSGCLSKGIPTRIEEPVTEANAPAKYVPYESLYVNVPQGSYSEVYVGSMKVATVYQSGSVIVPKTEYVTKSGVSNYEIVNVASAATTDAASENYVEMVVAFEDTKDADHDYNDLVFQAYVHIKNMKDGSNITTADITPIAYGARKTISLGVVLNGADGQSGSDVGLFSDCRAQMFNGDEGFINTNIETNKYTTITKDLGQGHIGNVTGISWFIEVMGQRLYASSNFHACVDNENYPQGLVLMNLRNNELSFENSEGGLTTCGNAFWKFPQEGHKIMDVYPGFDSAFAAKGDFSCLANPTGVYYIDAIGAGADGVINPRKCLYALRGDRASRIYSYDLAIPSSFPAVVGSNYSTFVPNWTLGRGDFMLGKNYQTYECFLVSTDPQGVDIYDIPVASSCATETNAWKESVGRGQYFIPQFPDGCKKARITFGAGFSQLANRKDPKIVFAQGNDLTKLVVSGDPNQKDGTATTFGEHQIVSELSSPSKSYQHLSGSIIDFGPYWDESATYHLLVVRGYSPESVASIPGCTVEFIEGSSSSPSSEPDPGTDPEPQDPQPEDPEPEDPDPQDPDPGTDPQPTYDANHYAMSVAETFPDVQKNSRLIGSWSLGSTTDPFKFDTNTQKYETILLSTNPNGIDIKNMKFNTANTGTWSTDLEAGKYFLPQFPAGCKQAKVTFEDGFELNNSRKDPKIIFIQGNSLTQLIVQGNSSRKDGNETEFAERQIVPALTGKSYEYLNGSVIDFSPYWDDSYTYHLIAIRGYSATSESAIKGCSIEFIEGPAPQSDPYEFMGTVTREVAKSFQGALYRDGEVFQTFDGGYCMVFDAQTLETKRHFTLPSTRGSGHHSSIEWLDQAGRKFISTCCASGKTQYAQDLYIYDISDESNVTIQTLTCPGLDPTQYAAMSCIAYDPTAKICYLAGYSPSCSSRQNLIISAVDMAPYLATGATELELKSQFTTEIYHLQDGGFFNGKLYYLVDNNKGPSGGYNKFAAIEIDPVAQKISKVYDIPQSTYYEGEGFYIVNDAAKPYLVLSYWHGELEYYYKYTL